MLWFQSAIAIIGLVCLGVAAGYAVLVLVAVLAWQLRKRYTVPLDLSAVTILKPLYGAEPGLYENLRSFCRQNHPKYQIVFGVGDHTDPALRVAKRLASEFAHLPIDIVVSSAQHGSNRKISSLINMLAHAQHSVLAISDSDARVGPDYLASVTAPLSDSEVGLVTCIYRGVPTRQLWSRLGAMYINDWYMPSVMLAWLFGHQSYVSGQTLCLRRRTLDRVGGLRALVNHLADDYHLGELVRSAGLRIVLSDYLLEAEHHEPSLDQLLRHELRWMRTIHVLRPGGFRMIFFTFSLPMALVGMAFSVAEPVFAELPRLFFEIMVIARLALHFRHRPGDDRSTLADIWLLPARDLLICWVWCRSFFISRITWRGHEFDVGDDGIMHRVS